MDKKGIGLFRIVLLDTFSFYVCKMNWIETTKRTILGRSIQNPTQLCLLELTLKQIILGLLCAI